MNWKEVLESYSRSKALAVSCLVVVVAGAFAIHEGFGMIVLGIIGAFWSVRY